MSSSSRKYVVLTDEDWATLTDLASAAGTNRPGWIRAAIAGAVRTGTLATGPVVHQASGLQVATLPSAVPAVSWRHESGAHGVAMFDVAWRRWVVDPATADWLTPIYRPGPDGPRRWVVYYA